MHGTGVPTAFVVGGSGFIGLAVARALDAAGYRVTAACRTPEGTARIHAAGLDALPMNLTLVGPWLDRAAEADIVVYAAQERPAGRLGGGWLRKSAFSRDVGLGLLLDRLVQRGTCRAFIHTSSIITVGDHGVDWMDEISARHPSPLGDFHAAGEAMVAKAAAAGLNTVVLRPGLVYGPDGSFADLFIRNARKGGYPTPGDGNNFLPWVHVEDLARAYVLAAANPPHGETIHVTDNDPVPLRRFAPLLVELVRGSRTFSLPRPLFSALAGSAMATIMGGSHRSDNDKAKRLLGWSPHYPTIEAGLPDTIAAFDSALAAPVG